MIIRQWQQVLDQTKRQTRRLHDTYKVGSVQAVIPKYLHPSVWWKPQTGEIVENPRSKLEGAINRNTSIKVVNAMMSEAGYQRARILITDKRHEPVQDITEADAIDEGVIADKDGFYVPILGCNELYATAVDAYHALWMSINTRNGTRWQDSPMVYVYTFALVR